MAAGRFCPFDPPKPLVERLDDDFFRAIPSGPGVYLMCGATEGVLYVGKAHNLRKRLARLTRSHPLARPLPAFTFGRIPFAASQAAQVSTFTILPVPHCGMMPPLYRPSLRSYGPAGRK